MNTEYNNFIQPLLIHTHLIRQPYLAPQITIDAKSWTHRKEFRGLITTQSMSPGIYTNATGSINLQEQASLIKSCLIWSAKIPGSVKYSEKLCARGGTEYLKLIISSPDCTIRQTTEWCVVFYNAIIPPHLHVFNQHQKKNPLCNQQRQRLVTQISAVRGYQVHGDWWTSGR